MWKWIILAIIVIILIAALGVTFWVQTEAAFKRESLVEGSGDRALILYHPSRDAHFSDDLTLALAHGFDEAGMAVDRWTMTRSTPPRPENYAVVAVVSNTFYGSPDWPTMRYLGQARFDAPQVIAIIGGGGNTKSAEDRLSKALERTGARRLQIRSLWISRPNEPGAPDVDNRKIAMRLAQYMARQAGERALQNNLADPAHREAITRSADQNAGLQL